MKNAVIAEPMTVRYLLVWKNFLSLSIAHFANLCCVSHQSALHLNSIWGWL